MVSLSKNLKNIQEEVNKISSSEVKIVAVTKNRDVSLINELISIGVTDIAENYLDEAILKFPLLIGSVKKHFIGPIQSNKVKKIVENFDLIQSVSRLKIAKLIDKYSLEMNKIMPILIQINISQEDTKSGVPFEEVEKFISEIQELKNIKVIGIMTIGSRENYLKEFWQMKGLFDSLALKGYFMKILSMGMSEDYIDAVKSGSNMIRLGRILFDDININSTK